MENAETICQNKNYECSLVCVENKSFCVRHILQDPVQKLYSPCNYLFPNSKQCGQPKLVEENRDSTLSTYCIEHSRHNQIEKTKSTIGSFRPLETTEVLTSKLIHHVKIDKGKPQSTTKLGFDEDEEVDVVTPTVDPFTDVNALEIVNHGRNILDYASDSSTDDEALMTLSNTWKCHEMEHSDNESDGSSDEDVLKHAGVYTIDELVTLSKQKMERLQQLYIDQFQRLQYVLKEKRKQYLLDLKKEKETLCSINDQWRGSPKERKIYENLKSLNRYHRRFGVEALLHRQYMEKRKKQLESIQSVPAVSLLPKNIAKCIYTEGGVKCAERVVPCCRYCRKHILEDKKQILFKACGIEKSGVGQCQEPTMMIFEDATAACVLHTTLPSPRVYMKRKYESETEDEEEQPQIKKEVSSDITTTEPLVLESGIKIESTSHVVDSGEVIVE